MAIKIKKRRDTVDPEDLPEVDEAGAATIPDDEVLAASRKTFGWLQENRKIVIGVVVALFVGIIAASAWLQGSRARKADSAVPLFSALDAAQTPAHGADGYEGLLDRATAIRNALAGVSGADGATALLEGRAALEADEADAAVGSYQAAASAWDGAEGAVARFGVASALAASGDLSGALTVLDEIAASGEYWAFSVALERATLIDAYGEPDAALDAWEALLAEFPDRRGLDYATSRVTQLEIALGVEEETEPSDEEG